MEGGLINSYPKVTRAATAIRDATIEVGKIADPALATAGVACDWKAKPEEMLLRSCPGVNESPEPCLEWQVCIMQLMNCLSAAHLWLQQFPSNHTPCIDCIIVAAMLHLRQRSTSMCLAS
jgi:hypothetical protein